MPFFSKLSASLYVDETVPRTPRTVTLIKCLIHCNDAETPNFCSRCIHPSIHDNLAVYVVGLGFICIGCQYICPQVRSSKCDATIPFACHQSLWHLRIDECIPCACRLGPLASSSSPVAQPALYLSVICSLSCQHAAHFITQQLLHFPGFVLECLF